MRKIELTQGKYALVDDEDYETLSEFKWCASSERGRWYAIRRGRVGVDEPKTVRMHRQILSPPKGLDIDHINQNGLDNRKDNLRICTRTENNMNMRIRKDNTTGYRGVCFDKSRGLYVATLVGRHIGRYETSKEAAIAYNGKAKELYGEYARLNKI